MASFIRDVSMGWGAKRINSGVRKGERVTLKAHSIFREEECILREQQGGAVG